MKISTFLSLALFILSISLATAARAQDECAALAPKGGEDLSEEFKGKILGEVEGVVAKLAGGRATIVGEYKRLQKDTLKDYPEPNKLFAWQTIIFLACVRPEANIDVSELFRLFLSGPPEEKANLVFPNFEFKKAPGNSKLVISNTGGQVSAMTVENKLYLNVRRDFCDDNGNNFFKASDLGRVKVSDQNVIFSFLGEVSNTRYAAGKVTELRPVEGCMWTIETNFILKLSFLDKTGNRQVRYVGGKCVDKFSYYSRDQEGWMFGGESYFDHVEFTDEDDWRSWQNWMNKVSGWIEIGGDDWNVRQLGG